MLTPRFVGWLRRVGIWIVGLAQGDAPWDDVIATAGRFGLRRTPYISLSIAAQALGANIPEAVLSSLRPSSETVAYLESALPKTDVVRFDGHRMHPVNLACVLLNDSVRGCLSLIARAPFAFLRWRRRLAEERRSSHLSSLSTQCKRDDRERHCRTL